MVFHIPTMIENQKRYHKRKQKDKEKIRTHKHPIHYKSIGVRIGES